MITVFFENMYSQKISIENQKQSHGVGGWEEGVRHSSHFLIPGSVELTADV